jgi:hypothetical protein
MMPKEPVDAMLYRAALYLYPPAFREEYSQEMLLDFQDARRDALAAGPRRLRWMFWAEIAVDLCRSLLMQWLRTGLPLIGATAITCSLAVVLALLFFWQAPFIVQVAGADIDVLLSGLLSTIVLLIVAGTAILTTWFTRTTRRRREF